MRTALLLLFVASPLWGAPPTLVLPAEVKGEPGTFIAIRAETDAAWVNFKADAGLAVFPAGLLSDPKATVLTASKPGRYRVWAYSGNDDGGVDREVTVIIGAPPPEPPPGPNPPGPPSPPVVDPALKPTAAVYVYEKDSGGVPSPVMTGLNRLNREKKLLSTAFEEDSPNGSGEVPKQYKAAVAAARESGLPALVVTAGDKVLKVIKAPKTEAAVMEAVP